MLNRTVVNTKNDEPLAQVNRDANFHQEMERISNLFPGTECAIRNDLGMDVLVYKNGVKVSGYATSFPGWDYVARTA